MGYAVWVLLVLLWVHPAWAMDHMVSGALYDFGTVKSFSNSDGTTGAIYDFGAIKSYQDSRGTTGTIYEFGGITTYQFSTPRRQPVPPAQTVLPSLSDDWGRDPFSTGRSLSRRNR